MTATDRPKAPRELREHLGAILRRERVTRYGDTKEHKQAFASALSVGVKTMERLEAGGNTKGLEGYVAKYAALLLAKDPRPWWDEAVTEWKAGAAPSPPNLQEAFAKPIREQAQRAQEARKREARGNREGPSGRSGGRRASQ